MDRFRLERPVAAPSLLRDHRRMDRLETRFVWTETSRSPTRSPETILPGIESEYIATLLWRIRNPGKSRPNVFTSRAAYSRSLSCVCLVSSVPSDRRAE